MHIERPLQIGMALLAAFGAALLGLGQQQTILPLVAVLVAATSLVLVDFRGRFHLTTAWSNAACVVALALAAWKLRYSIQDDVILAMADLLVYLQFILLLKRKTARVYWLLLAINLLQVAVACAINQSLSFGLLLVAYLVVALPTLGWFYLWREQQSAAVRPVAADPAPGASRSAVVLEPLPAEPGVARIPVLSYAVHCVGLTLVTLGMMVVMFLMVPRVGQTTWRPIGAGVTRVVGFTPEVHLDSGGPIVDAGETVMQLRLTDLDTGLPYPHVADLHLRGSVLERYERGDWTDSRRRRPEYGLLPPPEQFTEDAAHDGAGDRPVPHLVRQEFTLEPSATEVLFSVAPPLNESAVSSHVWDRVSLRVPRNQRPQNFRWSYRLLTSGLRDGRQLRWVPSYERADQGTLSDRARRLLEMPRLPDGSDPLAGLRQLAAVQVAALPDGDVVGRIRRLEAFFRTSGGFRYTLAGVERTPELDPVEDFVTRSRAGHCEFFASGLVLMLRSVGVPARIVVGYRQGEWNTVGGYYQFDQTHAHAWAEAYVAPEQLPADVDLKEPWLSLARQNGAWLQLEPTPAAAGESELSDRWGWYALKQSFDYASFLWANYVLGMDAQQQQESVYAPIVAALGNSLRDAAAWLDAPRATDPAAPAVAARSAWWAYFVSGAWFNWRVGALAMLVSFVGYYLALGAWAAGRWLAIRLGWGLGPRRARRGPSVPFYREFEELLARHALERPAGQTPREFAVAVGGQLASSAPVRPAAGLPRQIVEAYYRVRFGGRALDRGETESVEAALRQLAEALPAGRRRR